jgi:hypothetical protein
MKTFSPKLGLLLLAIISFSSPALSLETFICTTNHHVEMSHEGELYNDVKYEMGKSFTATINRQKNTIRLYGSHFGDGFIIDFHESPNEKFIYGQTSSSTFVLDLSASEKSEKTVFDYSYASAGWFIRGSVGDCMLDVGGG